MLSSQQNSHIESRANLQQLDGNKTDRGGQVKKNSYVWHPDASITRGQMHLAGLMIPLSRHIFTCAAVCRGSFTWNEPWTTKNNYPVLAGVQLTCGQLAMLYSRFIYLFLSRLRPRDATHARGGQVWVGLRRTSLCPLDRARRASCSRCRSIAARERPTDWLQDDLATAQGCHCSRCRPTGLSRDGSHEAIAKVDAVFALIALSVSIIYV